MKEQGINLITFTISCGNNKDLIPFIMATVGIGINGEKTICAAEDRRLIIAIFRAIWENNALQKIKFVKKICIVAKIIFQINCPKKTDDA